MFLSKRVITSTLYYNQRFLKVVRRSNPIHVNPFLYEENVLQKTTTVMNSTIITNPTHLLLSPFLKTDGILDQYNDNKWTLDLFFKTNKVTTVTLFGKEQKIQDMDVFREQLLDFENQIIRDAITNSELWFGKKIEDDIIEYTFCSMVHPTFVRCNILNKDSIEIYDTQNNLLFPNNDKNSKAMDFIIQSKYIACVLDLSQLWVHNFRWGCNGVIIKCIISMDSPNHSRMMEKKGDVVLFYCDRRWDKKIKDENLFKNHSEKSDTSYSCCHTYL